jgi:ribonuclease D
MNEIRQAEVKYIDTDEHLHEFCQSLQGAEYIAVDTEFAREKTYFPKLCLIQVQGKDQIACIDPLVITNFEPLLDLFRDTSITKVLHSVSQDMEVFLHTFDCLPTPVYDTQIAASLTGLGEQVSYAKLVESMLDIRLDKSHTRTDWSRRPLDAAQIKYAADDVRYLAELYPVQRQQLEQQGRLSWLEIDFEEITRESRYRPDPDNAWRRVKGYARLRGVELAILKFLAQYRENQAIRSDRPRRFILKDDLLLDLAKARPKTLQDIERRRGFENVIHRHGKALLDCVQAGLKLPQEEWPDVSKGKPLSAQQEVIADILMALLKQQSKKNDVSVGSMASKKDVDRLARGKRDIALMTGWRYELGGKVLVEFLEGSLALSVSDNQLVLLDR